MVVGVHIGVSLDEASDDSPVYGEDGCPLQLSLRRPVRGPAEST
jgi:hypothetical protein